MFGLSKDGKLIDVTPPPAEWLETRKYVEMRDTWRANEISEVALEMYRHQLRVNPDSSGINRKNLSELISILEPELFPRDYDRNRIINYYDRSRKQLYEWYLIVKDQK